MLIAFFSALVVSMALCPLAIRLAPRLRLMDAPDQPRKSQPQPVARTGGVAIWLGVTIALLLTPPPFPWPFWMSITAMMLVGLVDDRFRLGAFVKLALQLLVALLLWTMGSRVTLFISWPGASLILTFIWFVGMVNAMNYMDNMNGLCAGTGLVIVTALGAVHATFLSGDLPDVGLESAAVAGALLGFLPWNFPKGRLFLGDSGSHLVGAAVAVLIMETTFVHATRNESPRALLAAPLLVLVPLLDFIQVTIGRLRRGQPIWKGDAHHLSHLLVRAGFNPPVAVMILWLCTVLSVAAAIVGWQLAL